MRIVKAGDAIVAHTHYELVVVGRFRTPLRPYAYWELNGRQELMPSFEPDLLAISPSGRRALINVVVDGASYPVVVDLETRAGVQQSQRVLAFLTEETFLSLRGLGDALGTHALYAGGIQPRHVVLPEPKRVSWTEGPGRLWTEAPPVSYTHLTLPTKA